MKKRTFLLVLTFLFIYSTSAFSAIIEYDVVNVSGNQWKYTYYLDYAFVSGDGFDIAFAVGPYTNLLDASMVSADWEDLEVFQPDDPVGADGLFQAFATTDAPDLTSPFMVTFDWSAMGDPGSQAFTVFDANFGIYENGSTVLRGTNVIPEPGTLILLGFGMLAMAGTARRRTKN